MSTTLTAGARIPATVAGPAPATYLFVPGHRPELIAKARRSSADAVVIDLEDAVAPDQRPAARAATAVALIEHAALVRSARRRVRATAVGPGERGRHRRGRGRPGRAR